MAGAVSPLAPKSIPALPPIDGVRLASHAAGIRYKVRSDLMVVVLDEGTTVGGVLTRSLTASAPVESCRAHLKSGSGRVLVVNAGNANTFTGRRGVADVVATCESAAKVFGCKPNEVFVSSTGTIGVPLPVDKITEALPLIPAKLNSDWLDAAKATMTTDTFPKLATRTAKIEGVAVTINGFCKGSGMIAPDMGTMLAYVFTDAALAAPVAQTLIAEGADIIDVGGESSRPRALAVPTDEELRRVLPVIEGLAGRIRISVDTVKEEVARAAAAAGATLINDVSSTLGPVAAELGVGWVAMHRQGSAATMQENPHYEDVVREVRAFLEASVHACGVGEVWIDPGIGFGKTVEHNLQLLAALDAFASLGQRVMVGTSR